VRIADASRTPLLFAWVALLLLLPRAVLALERTALVVGNGAYKDAPLKNPVNDAFDVAQTLKALGFQVILQRDVGQQELEKAIRQFKKSLQQRGVWVCSSTRAMASR